MYIHIYVCIYIYTNKGSRAAPCATTARTAPSGVCIYIYICIVMITAIAIMIVIVIATTTRTPPGSWR